MGLANVCRNPMGGDVHFRSVSYTPMLNTPFTLGDKSKVMCIS